MEFRRFSFRLVCRAAAAEGKPQYMRCINTRYFQQVECHPLWNGLGGWNGPRSRPILRQECPRGHWKLVVFIKDAKCRTPDLAATRNIPGGSWSEFELAQCSFSREARRY